MEIRDNLEGNYNKTMVLSVKTYIKIAVETTDAIDIATDISRTQQNLHRKSASQQHHQSIFNGITTCQYQIVQGSTCIDLSLHFLLIRPREN